MKNVVMLFVAAVALFNTAHADAAALVCLAGSFKADGTVAMMSGNDAQVAGLQDGTISLYSLIDDFSLYNTQYNRSQPFDMSLVTPHGVADTYTMNGTAVAAKWMIENGAETRLEADLTVDTATLKGNLETNKQMLYNGNWMWAGSSMDGLECTTAGIR